MVKKILLLIPIILAIQLVSAATIFSDTFESGGLAGWTLTNAAGANNWTASSTDPFQGSWHAFGRPIDADDPASTMEKIISTSTFNNINFSYYRKLNLGTASHTFRAKWFDGSVWTAVEDVTGTIADSNYVLKSFLLPSGASNNLNFAIKFECTESTTTKDCKVDNVSISGTIIDSTPPIITINFPINNAFYNSILNFNVSLNENGSVMYSLNGGINNKTMIFTSDHVSFFGNLFNHTNSSIADGSYTFSVYANDTNGNKNYTSSSLFTYDTLNPLLSLLAPQNTTYNTNNLQLNYSVSDNNLDSCWYTENNGQTNTTLTNCQNISYTASQNSTTIKIYANDSAGNINSSSVTFFVDSIFPLISFASPTELNNTSISFSSILINVSVIEVNEANITFSLHNLTSLVNLTTFITSQRTINFTNLKDDVYFYNVTIKDSLNNQNTTETRTLTIDTTPPSISIVSPQNTTYTNDTILINISSNGDNIWFYNGTANESYTSPVYRILSQGSNTIISYANDSLGNQNTTSTTLFIDSIAPSLTLSTPVDGSTFGTNISLALNYSVSDSNLNSCWYNLDNSNNVSLQNCANNFFNTSAGQHTLYLFANDTLNNKIIKNTSFTISIGAPAIIQSSPLNTFLNSSNINFNYTPADVDLNSCELWGNFTGQYSLNQTNNTLVSGKQSLFNLNLPDSEYQWAIRCNDTIGNSAITGNKTFSIDTLFPTLSISEPSGTKSSRDNIPLTFSASDNNLNSCWYNLYRGSNLEISNTSLICNQANSFNVTLDASFALNIYANDTANNLISTSTSFTTDTSSPSPGSNPGSSGGGGSSGSGSSSGFSIPSKKQNSSLVLSVAQLNNFIIKRGTNITSEIEVSNDDKKFANNCKLLILSPLDQFISNSDLKGISPGEKAKFLLNINAPLTAEIGRFNGEIVVKCDEGETSLVTELLVYRNSFEARLINYERETDKLKVSYVLEEFSQKDHDIKLTYKIIDPRKILVLEGSEKILLKAGERQENDLIVDIPKGLTGEFDLEIVLSDDTASNQLTEKLDLGKLTGFAISAENRKTLSKFGFVLIALIGGFFAIRFIYKYYRQKVINPYKNRIEYKHGRRLIKIDLKRHS
ncbi:MAG: hypothetical protein Q7S27_05265 [Nanoarchaeota archaeon]|nr:hypothetical protein [Nanoarchaeota archaeon]